MVKRRMGMGIADFYCTMKAAIFYDVVGRENFVGSFLGN